MYKKSLYVIAIFLFMICISGCNNNDDKKIKIDMSDVIWDYSDDIEYDGTSHQVRLMNLPQEVTANYGKATIGVSPGEYTTSMTLSYDTKKYELINNNVPKEINWKIWDVFYVNEAENNVSSNHHLSNFDTRYTRRAINYIHFVNYVIDDETRVTEESPYLWSEYTNEELHLYIGFDPTKYKNIKLPSDSSYYFAYMHNLEGITGLEYIDTSRVTNMKFMFYSTGYSSDNFTLDLSSFNTKNVTNMESMFERTGENNENFTLNLGSNFDTSKVTNMKSMFESCGFDSKVFTLDLGNKFNTRNVTDMSSMFEKVGYYSSILYIDLGETFDISNVTKFDRMFIYIYAAENTDNWNLKLKGSIKEGATFTDMFFGFAPKINKTIYVDSEITENKLMTEVEKLGSTPKISINRV